jgi:hypothetical protein
MISIKPEDVQQAMRDIDRLGILNRNRSRGYCVSKTGRPPHYPPKEVLRRAYRIAHGKPLRKLHGGPQTNKPLEKAGFHVSNCVCGNTGCKFI